jgi:hypothetical protein
LLPLVVPKVMEFKDFAETTAFNEIARIISALSVADERIVEELKVTGNGRVPKKYKRKRIINLVAEDGLPIGLNISLTKFADAISVRAWEKVARMNWRPFDEARKFVRKLGLKGQTDWVEYCSSGQRPADIPAAPETVYTDWIDWGDWLGTGRTRRKRSFEDARAFARSLKLKSVAEWQRYCSSGKKPNDIPRKPFQAYAKRGWISWGDWLGTGTIASRLFKYLSFEKARTFVRSLGLGSQKEWLAYCRSGKKPVDIPQSPWKAYPDKWIDLFDWLGNGQARRNQKAFRPFEIARAFVRRLGIKTIKEWLAYCESGKKPHDIPKWPSGPYAKDWIDWADWLGSNQIQARGKWRPFKEARVFVRSLGLKSNQEWRVYLRSRKKPNDIPANPPRPYRKDWISWQDWLGTDDISLKQAA